MTKDEKGIQAIIELQAVAGINETKEQAREGWRKMTNSEKENTLAAHEVLLGGFVERRGDGDSG